MSSHRGQLHCLNHATLSFHSHTMGPRLHSPIHKMTPVRTSSQASEDRNRKRVGKACDRCRMKKSKCDGEPRCSRCKSDNAICEFGERKRNHDKVYPKGYTEVLERLTGQLTAAIGELYKREKAGRSCFGEGINEVKGAPLTHDVLVDLGLLPSKPGSSGEEFEDSPSKLQQRLLDRGAEMTTRRTSISSGSEHSAQNELVQTPSDFQSMPFDTKPNVNGLSFSAPSSRPSSQSPPVDHVQAYLESQSRTLLRDDPPFHQAPWALQDDNSNPMLRTNSFAMESPMGNSYFNNTMDGLEPFPQWNPHQATHLSSIEMNLGSFQPYSQQPSNHFAGPVLHHDPNMVDYDQFF